MSKKGSLKVKAYNKEYRLKNKASIFAYNNSQTTKDRIKKWYENNKEHVLKSCKEYKKKYATKIRLQNKEYGEKNKTIISLKNKKYYIDHKSNILLNTKNYRNNNKKKINIYFVKRKKNDIQFKLGCVLRRRIFSVLKKNIKVGSAIKDLGCTVTELKIWLENQFQSGMTWNNHGMHGWHIDHKLALANFDLTDRKQFLIACHYTNLQPMWARENIRKSNKI